MSLELSQRLIDTLKNQGIVFCHWKSNLYLKDALDKNGELDLLVSRRDAQRFEGVLARLGFERVIESIQTSPTAVFHFYGLDQPSGILVHLHVYYQVITGESLLKNYCLPLEGLLLQNLRMVEGMPVPQVSAELLILVIRAMAKHSSLFEYLMLQRQSGYQTLRDEIKALMAGSSAESCAKLLKVWLPSVDGTLFKECLTVLGTNASLARRFWLARQLRKQLSMYERFTPLSAILFRTVLVLNHAIRHLAGNRKTKQFACGGMVIAFVGPEATGKSTLVRETTTWLAQAFDVSSAHLGKPPSTWLTFLPNLALPILRRVASKHRTSRVKVEAAQGNSGNVSLLYAVRSMLVAWDRRSLAVRLHRRAANGGIVICDRYPSALVGAMDSARLSIPSETNGTARLLGFLARLEQSIYQQIPPPDLVIQLTVPVQVALQRNQERQKQEPDHYVLRRHSNTRTLVFPISTLVELDSNQPQLRTVRAVQDIIWNAL